MKYFLLMLLSSMASAGGISQGGEPSGNLTGSAVTASTITITGTGPSCFNAGGFIIDCTNKSLTGVAGSSVTLTGAGGLGVTYGITAATAAFGSANANAAVSLVGNSSSQAYEGFYRSGLGSARKGYFGDIGGTYSFDTEGNGNITLRGGNVGIETVSPTTALSVYGVITSSTTQGTTSAGTISATCSDQHCALTPGAVTAVTYTFGTAWPQIPDCVALTNAAVPLALSITAVSKTALTITSGTALTGDIVTFICMGAP